MNTLDRWELGAKLMIRDCNCSPCLREDIPYQRILSLIDLVNKKDIELGDIAMSDCSDYIKGIADRALALTSGLK